MNLRSDCVVQFFEPKLVCSLCGREGHSNRSCDLSPSKVGQNMPHDDFLFWSYVDPCDRPEGFV